MPYMRFVETELSQIDGSENRLPGIPGSVKCPPGRLETLAMASAEAGLFDEAVRLQRRVIQMMTWDGRLDALPRLEANLARYRAGQICCADAPSSE